jgi:hypothetical protein
MARLSISNASLDMVFVPVGKLSGMHVLRSAFMDEFARWPAYYRPVSE